MRYLLDTNVVSDLVRNPQEKWRQRNTQGGEGKFVPASLSRRIAYGLQEGLATLSSQLEIVLGVLEVLPFETPADAAYGLLRTRLSRLARQSGQRSVIAAQALALGYTIVNRQRKGVCSSGRPCTRGIGCARTESRFGGV